MLLDGDRCSSSFAAWRSDLTVRRETPPKRKNSLFFLSPCNQPPSAGMVVGTLPRRFDLGQSLEEFHLPARLISGLFFLPIYATDFLNHSTRHLSQVNYLVPPRRSPAGFGVRETVCAIFAPPPTK